MAGGNQVSNKGGCDRLGLLTAKCEHVCVVFWVYVDESELVS